MEERNKCKFSVIIRGLPAPTSPAANEQFQQVATYLLSCEVPPSSIASTDRGKQSYRAEAIDLELRKRLLDSAKTLEDSPSSQVSINRGLTYQQRKELAERRDRWTVCGQTGPTLSPLLTLFRFKLDNSMCGVQWDKIIKVKSLKFGFCNVSSLCN